MCVYYYNHVCLGGVYYSGSWSARDLNRNQWIQVEFNQVKTILGIVMKGRGSSQTVQFVKTYGVLYRTDDGSDWITLTNGHGHNQVIQFNFTYPTNFAICAKY